MAALLGLAYTAACSTHAPPAVSHPPRSDDAPAPHVVPLCPSSTPVDLGTEAARATEDPNKRALLIGINDYEHADIPDLAGTLNDVAAMTDVLVRRFGFAPENVQTLTNAAATRDGILAAIRSHLIDASTKRTVAVLYYSGHGSQRRDPTREEADGWDETWVPHDSSHAGTRENRDITDDEIKMMLSELSSKAGQVTVISDSCHSGTVARSVVGTPRLAPVDERPVPPTPSSRAANDRTTGLRAPNASYALISGARSDEYAYERTIDGQKRGALTHSLVGHLWKAHNAMTYRDIMARVAADVTSNFPAQHPQLEGSEQDTELFGRREWLVQPSADAWVEGGSVFVSVGAIHGVTPGSELGVYPPGTKRFSAAPPIRVRLGEVQTAVSKAKVVAGRGTITAGSRAVLLEVRHASTPLRVFLDEAPSSTVLREVRKSLARYPHVQLTPESNSYDLRLRERQEGVYLDRGTAEFATLVAAGSQATSRTEQRVLEWAKWNAVQRLASPTGPGNPQPPAELEVVAKESPVPAGGTVRLRVKSQSSKPLYVSLLNLSYDGGIAVVFPPRGAVEKLAPGQTWEQEVITSVGDARTELAVDRVKLFVSEQPHDLRFLEQAPQPEMELPRSKGTGPTCLLPFEAQLGTSALGITRGLTPAPTASVLDWYTEEAIVAIRPAR